MEAIKDLRLLHKRVKKQTIKALKQNPTLIFAGIIYMFVILLSNEIDTFFRYSNQMSSMPTIIGFVIGIMIMAIKSAMISAYLYLIYKAINGQKVNYPDMQLGFKYYLNEIWGLIIFVYFIFMILDMVLLPLFFILPASYFVVRAIVFGLFSAVPETAYQKHLHIGDMFIYAWNFVKGNMVQWLLPNFIMLGGLYIIYVVLRLELSHIFPYFYGSRIVVDMLLVVILQVLVTFIMLYRGFLYRILSTSTMRKRLFMRHMYED